MIPDEIDALGRNGFKKLMFRVFEKMGFKVDNTMFKKGMDIDCVLEDAEYRKIAVKLVFRKTRFVSDKAIKQVLEGKDTFDCENALVITNYAFGSGCMALAKQFSVDLWDRELLQKQLKAVGEIKQEDIEAQEAAAQAAEKEFGPLPEKQISNVDLTPRELDAMQEAIDLADKLELHHKHNRLFGEYFTPYDASQGPPAPGNIGPYWWQVDFHNASNNNQERCLMAANRVGKTHGGGGEAAMHLTGLYPDWYRGRRFSRPVDAWAGGDTSETVRDIVQKALLGGVGDYLGTGWIPREHILEVKMRQGGIADSVDNIKVRHSSGGISYLGFKTYDQGRKKWQGTKKDFIWMDEEPPEDVYTEALTRLADNDGLMLLTFTPLNGVGDVVQKFLDGGDSIYLINVTWDDAPHLDEKVKARMLKNYPKHQRDTRTKGVPMAGSGLVFTTPDDDISIAPFEIPQHFRRIAGIDLGYDHPFASVWIAYDADEDIIYTYDCYKQSDQGLPYHASTINRRGTWIPVAWPHDGMKRDPGSGVIISQQLRDLGVNMLPMSARYKPETGGSQPTEPIIFELDERMRTGRFKVFSHLGQWFSEKRMYHREDGQLVRERDDLLAATFYACMMLRFADTMRRNDPVQRDSGQDDYRPVGW